jgi:ribonuclease HI
MTARKQVTMYTDGGALGNPGPGGYGAILIYNGHRKELSGGYRYTTNNRMELMGAIVALRALKYPCSVTLHTDSRYLVDAMTKGWAKRWRSRGWMRNKKDRALNADLWKELLELTEKHDVTFLWVKGHSGQPENERCDALVKEEARKDDLPPDVNYEAENPPPRHLT